MTCQMIWTKNKWKASAMKRTSTQTSALHSYQTLTLRWVDPSFPFEPQSFMPCTNKHKDILTHTHIQALQYTSVISKLMIPWSTGKLWTSTWFLQWCWWSHSYSNIEGQVLWKIKGLSLSLSPPSLPRSQSFPLAHTHTPYGYLICLSCACLWELNWPNKLDGCGSLHLWHETGV